jgi:hypothetical protein
VSGQLKTVVGEHSMLNSSVNKKRYVDEYLAPVQPEVALLSEVETLESLLELFNILFFLGLRLATILPVDTLIQPQ